uniref:Uncharacterized protein n=1 Tax=Tetranychus urticae TaxID=32264 RepID=T1KA85_TETUR
MRSLLSFFILCFVSFINEIYVQAL